MPGKCFMTLTLVLVVYLGQSSARDNRWFFNPDAMADAYRYQRQFGARLRNPLDPQACLYGQKEFAASYRGKRFLAPCRFAAETVRQLKELLESGAAKYLFPLDVGYARLAVPADVYASKYERLPEEEIWPALLREPALVAIYHGGLHLEPASSAKESAASAWAQKRTVAGYYDGRPNRVLPGCAAREAYCEAQGLVELGGFHLMEHFLGELGFVARDAVVTIDLSFDDDSAEAPPTSMVRVSVPAKR